MLPVAGTPDDLPNPTLTRNLTIGRSFCHHAADRIRRNLAGLFATQAHDRHILGAADAALGWNRDGPA
jgi:hypothetical protein